VEKIRVGVVGVGYLGQFHAEKYARMKGVELAGVVDVDFGRAKEIAKRYRTQPFPHHAELLSRVQAVSIAVPTPLHHAIARDFLRKGVDVLLEKPISTSLEEADDLIDLAESHDRVLQVGHLERFSGPLLALEGVVEKPMFIESNRLGPFLLRGTEVDVVLDLMIHDIDIILSWVPSKVKWFHAVGIPVLTPHIDIANVRVEFENGCTANLTASRVSREKMRKIRLFQPTGYLSIDFLRQKAILAGKKKEEEKKGLPGIFVKRFPVKKVDPLKMEIESFLRCVQTRGTPRVSGRDGRRALDLALQIVRSIQDLVARRVSGEPPQG
jgi:predicted dehydrogenase